MYTPLLSVNSHDVYIYSVSCRNCQALHSIPVNVETESCKINQHTYPCQVTILNANKKTLKTGKIMSNTRIDGK